MPKVRSISVLPCFISVCFRCKCCFQVAKVLYFFDTTYIILSFFASFQQNMPFPICLIPPSQMTQKSNRVCSEEIFAKEDEYRPYLRRCISLYNAEKLDHRKEYHTCLPYLRFISESPCFISLSTNARTSFGVIRHFVTSPWKVSRGISSNKSSFFIL